MYVQDIKTVNFYGDPLVTFVHNDEHYVAVEPVILHMGLDWDYFRRKLTDSMVSAMHEGTYDRYNVTQAVIIQDGVEASLISLPLKRLNAFLFGINPNQIKDPEVRSRVIKYQEECVIALHDYWMHGLAANLRTTPSDIDSGYKDARAFSRPALSKACQRLAAHGAKIGKKVDEEETYNMMITYAYSRLGISSAAISDKMKLDKDPFMSGFQSLKLAYIEMCIVAGIDHVVAYDHNVEDLPLYIEEHVTRKLTSVGNDFMALADFVPDSMFEDPQL